MQISLFTKLKAKKKLHIAMSIKLKYTLVCETQKVISLHLNIMKVK